MTDIEFLSASAAVAAINGEWPFSFELKTHSNIFINIAGMPDW